MSELDNLTPAQRKAVELLRKRFASLPTERIQDVKAVSTGFTGEEQAAEALALAQPDVPITKSQDDNVPIGDKISLDDTSIRETSDVNKAIVARWRKYRKNLTVKDMVQPGKIIYEGREHRSDREDSGFTAGSR